MSINFHLVRSDDERPDTVTAFFSTQEEPVRTADSNHPHWESILDGLRDGDEDVYDLFDVRGGVARKLRQLSERVSYDGSHIRFDGDVIDNALSEQILRFLEQGSNDWEALVNFWEKIAQNPNPHSRENLYRWLAAEEFSITPDGNIVGYKGVNLNKGTFMSTRSGTAFVNGEQVDGYIPNVAGSVITMPRADVTHDPNTHCHVGLHVGTFGYASSFTGTVLEVHVNPRDVVSVPSDSNGSKMRVCRYTVVKQVSGKYADAVVPVEDYHSESEWNGDVGYATSRY